MIYFRKIIEDQTGNLSMTDPPCMTHPTNLANDITWCHVTSLVCCSSTPITFLDPYFGVDFFMLGKIWILSLTWHGLRNFTPLIHIPHIHSWIFETLRVIIFWIRVTHKMLNVNWEKFHSIILSVTCHGLRNFPYSYTSPHIHLWIFDSLWVIIFWVRVTCKMLNVNWEKIQSIIWSVTCHGLRNFPLLIHIPSNPFVNFWNPMSYYFLS